MTISTNQLYDLLTQKLGKETAQSLVQFVEEKIEKYIEDKTKHLATKENVEKGFKEQMRYMLGIFITLVIMILGLYAAILFKK